MLYEDIHHKKDTCGVVTRCGTESTMLIKDITKPSRYFSVMRGLIYFTIALLLDDTIFISFY